VFINPTDGIQHHSPESGVRRAVVRAFGPPTPQSENAYTHILGGFFFPEILFAFVIAILGRGCHPGEHTINDSRNQQVFSWQNGLIILSKKFHFRDSDEFRHSVDPLLDPEKIVAKFGQLLEHNDIFARLGHCSFLRQETVRSSAWNDRRVKAF
jgi:hypothetical protein